MVRVPGAGAEEWAGPRCACAVHSTRQQRRHGRGKMEDFQASEEVTPGWATGGWWPRSRRGAAPPGKPQLLLSTATQPEADEPGWRFPAGHSESFPRGRCPCGLVDSVGLSSSAGG